MRIVTFLDGGQARPGIVLGSNIHRIRGHAECISVLRAGGEPQREADPAVAFDSAHLLPPVPNPAKIICVGLNYDEHRLESQRPKADHPTVFSRWADTQVGHRQPLICPAVSHRFDYEGELAVVIGRPGHRIAPERALDHVAGYSCYNEGSLRDWQSHTSQFTAGKNFPATGGFGPWLVVDEIDDPARLTLITRLNGQEMQRSGTDQMIFPVPELIAYISAFTSLDTGDVIVTGTPGGVGNRRTPPVYMQPGDVAEVEITGIGTLVNPVAAEA